MRLPKAELLGAIAHPRLQMVADGTSVVLVDRWFPSTELCSCCGQKKPMKLSERKDECDECGLTLDRDFNAALNLENYIRKAKPDLDTDG